MNFISPLLWQTIPYRDEDAWLDFLGMHETWHRVLAESQGTFSSRLDDLRVELLAHERAHDDLADKLGLTHVGDLTSYDLTEEESFKGFMWLHALDHERLRKAAGL